ncbi:MarR family transcriptional regulator [Virgibacillus phasianinus]|uniref:MarR family transcriptional regulator n=1 Tax=Virgibacillus phasianinus TaxID=2017483 RepID=A0A220U8B5_9BACI|nr:MarR family transcriptional regulator [Virgibacillus phasianinus]
MRIEYDHPIEVTLEVVCGKWKGVILCKLLEGTLRFGELKKQIPKISQKMLSQQLHELEDDGLVKRVAYNQIPPRVEYSLTPYGKDLEPALTMLSKWGENHVEVVTDSKAVLVAEKEGEV